MEFITRNFQETQKLAKDLVKKLSELAHRDALVLALQGELGAGKTTFIQGLAQALGIREKILSPTFVIQKRFMIYDLRFKNKFKNLYHLDCYRVNDFREIMALGFGQIVADSKNLIVVEWAEKIKDILPADTIWLKFEHGGEDRRKIKILNPKF